MAAVGGEGGGDITSGEAAVLYVAIKIGVALDEACQVAEFVQKGGQQVVAAIGGGVCGSLEVEF
ncbi:MAG: hypothetical protein AAF827_18955 [Cyanobacteria bacterium P01_D01_bin.6]